MPPASPARQIVPPTRPFRFAVHAPQAADRTQLIECARLAESLGYATLLISDHLLEQFAPLQALAAVAQHTSRLRLGTFVLNNDLRHPAVLAQELASLDVLSGGRLEIGLGAGWNVDEYRAAGMPFDRVGVRLARLRESVAIIQGLFGPGAFSFAGEHYQIQDMDGHPKPLQQPHPPFLIGAGGAQGLAYAARVAQIVGLAPRLPRPAQPDLTSLTAAATLEKVSWIREAAGSRFSELELNTYCALGPAQITDDARAAARALFDRLERAYGSSPSEDELLDSPHVLLGTVAQLVDKCLELRERYGITYINPRTTPEAFAPVIERLL